jgi:poly-gamma-glutamate synthesis protein (capsule biosynthesis protein)
MGTLKIACVGDTMCGDSFNLLGCGVASRLDRFGSDFLPPEIVDIFSSHDIVVCNLECVLSDIGRKESSLRSLHMRGRPTTAAYLAKWGVTVAHVANNHILEQGLESAIDTVQQLGKVGIRAVGAGKNGRFQSAIEPFRMNLNDQSIVVIGACFHNGKYAFSSELDEVLQTIRAEAGRQNLVIVSVHWGDELIDRPSLWQRKVARLFTDAGALLVIGHHPHVVQGIDDSNNTLVAYSLGNFIFDGHSELTSWTIILSVTLSGRKVIRWETIPIIKDKDYRPIIVRGERKDDLNKEIARRCTLLKQKVMDVEKYEREYVSELKSLEAESRHDLWLSIAKRFVCYRPTYWLQILLRPIQRRLGTW